MVNPPKIDVDELRDLVHQGLSNKEIAEVLNVGLRTVVRTKVRYGLASKDTKDHGEYIPWTLGVSEAASTPAKRLRLLSRAVQGGEVSRVHITTAFNWAKGIVDDGWDIAYDPDHEGTELWYRGGWKKVRPGERWILKELVDRLSAMTEQREVKMSD